MATLGLALSEIPTMNKPIFILPPYSVGRGMVRQEEIEPKG